MWRRTTALLLGLALSGTAPLQILGDEAAEEQGLLWRKRWIDFEIVQGRLTALHPRQGKNQTVVVEDPQSGRREQLTLHVRAGIPSLHYELLDDRQQLIVDVINADEVKIRRQLHGSADGHLLFSQPAQGPLELMVGDQRLTALSVWHLLLDYPHACQEHLIPILELLRPHWQLGLSVARLEENLFELASIETLPDRDRVDELVAQLGDPAFQRRQSADGALRAMGQAVLPHLESLEQAELDAEQQLRIRQIRASLAPKIADTPQRAAARLVAEKSIWLILLGHAQPAQRRLAAQHLSKLHQGPIAFDPLADRPQREEQIARLRTSGIQ